MSQHAQSRADGETARDSSRQEAARVRRSEAGQMAARESAESARESDRKGRPVPDLLHQFLRYRARQGGGEGAREERVRDRVPEAELLRDASGRRRRRRVRAEAGAREYRIDAPVCAAWI